jgi:carbon-monoxide dehydrogenase large subunit
LLALAADALEASPADLELRDGRVAVRGAPGRGLDLDAAVRLGSSPEEAAPALEAVEVFDPPGPAFSGAVHVASVEVDGDTGRVRVLDYAVVEDCGPLLNPRVVEGQVHGALAQGIGEALSERLVYDADGQLLTGTLMDYALPTAADLPAFAVGHRHTPSPLTAGGYKGMGEGGTVGAPACVASAVADALGERGAAAVRALPILPEPLLRALRGRTGSAE